MKQKRSGILSKKLVFEAIKESFFKLSPKAQIHNPVMFVVYLSAIFTTLLNFFHWSGFNFQISLWLWFTVLFANFASAIAESRGKAQAATLKKTQNEIYAKKLVNERETRVPATSLQKGDHIVCEIGDTIPADGEIISGIATVDESAITGESAPVIRESGGDRSAVTAGTRIMSDRIIIRVSSEKGHSFLDRMIALIEGAERKKTPNEISLSIVLSSLTLIFLLTIVSLKCFSIYSAEAANQNLERTVTPSVLVALLVCLIPTTISGLLDAIGISGMDRLIQRNVIAKSGRSVEVAGDIDLLILDKTGTITLGNRIATEFIPSPGISAKEFAAISQLASLTDETPEGRSVVILAKNKYNLRAETLNTQRMRSIEFSAQTKISGVDFIDDSGKVIRQIRKGDAEAIQKHVKELGGEFPEQLHATVDAISMQGATPLLVSENTQVMGIIHLKDVIKGGIKERCAKMRKIGISTIMITGDNPLTAAAIAAEAGVDDYVAKATPEIKLEFIREKQGMGHLIAMTGDGTNDAPALAQADVGVAMNTGTEASREAGNMVDLDSNPTKLLDIVEIGKQLLMTRGSLTTFSIANDIAKYFAIIPAIFGSLYTFSSAEGGPLLAFNIMHLQSPQSAIMSAVIFNALIIIALIPLALRGVPYKANTAAQILQHNLMVYGGGGILAPFVGIKLIDFFITTLGLV